STGSGRDRARKPRAPRRGRVSSLAAANELISADLGKRFFVPRPQPALERQHLSGEEYPPSEQTLRDEVRYAEIVAEVEAAMRFGREVVESLFDVDAVAGEALRPHLGRVDVKM